MVGMFENILEQCTENGTFTLNKKKYSFLRIIFLYKDRCGDLDAGAQKLYTLEEYTEMQIRYVLQGAHMLPK